jgi:ribose 5-phosphate isomerase B
MKIAIGSDHAGFRYKEILMAALAARGHEVIDYGTHSEAAVDYPIYIRPVAEAVAKGTCDRGIVLGGSGNGEAIVANRIRGIRCTLAWNIESARVGRSHNDSNVLSLGQRFVLDTELLGILDAWLDTPFDGGRHLRRINLIDAATS